MHRVHRRVPAVPMPSELRRRTSLSLVLGLALLLPTVALAAPWGYLVSPDGKIRKALDKPTVVIGSAPSADVVIQASTVSKRHASLHHHKGMVRVKDLGGQLGTLVAGTALRRGGSMQLLRRTKLTFGAVTWTFEWGDRGKIIAPLRPEKKLRKGRKNGKSVKKKARKQVRTKVTKRSAARHQKRPSGKRSPPAASRSRAAAKQK